MPRHLRANGICWVQLWPPNPRFGSSSSWVTHVGEEPLILSRKDRSWKFEGYNMHWYHNQQGEYVHAPANSLERPVLYHLQYHRFPTRRQALQALDGLLLARPEILAQDPKKR